MPLKLLSCQLTFWSKARHNFIQSHSYVLIWLLTRKLTFTTRVAGHVMTSPCWICLQKPKLYHGDVPQFPCVLQAVRKFPSMPQKAAIRDHLVSPLVDRSCHAVGFRVLWNIEDTEKLQVAWHSIAAARLQIDSLMEGIPKLAFFVSAISGMSNKASEQSLLDLSPAVAYWLALQDPHFDPYHLIAAIKANFPGVEVRLISNLMPSVESFTFSLCETLKDHCNDFIGAKLQESILACPGIPTTESTSKIMLTDQKFENFLKNALKFIEFSDLKIPVVDAFMEDIKDEPE